MHTNNHNPNAYHDDSRESAHALDAARLPKSVAIIMDGNGRWATSRQLPRMLGHRAGADAVRRTVEACCEIGIAYVTLYAFSSENWSRPKEEIHELMGLLDEFLAHEAATLHAQQVRLRAIGRLSELPANVLRNLESAMQQTAAYTRLTLTLALSYGGRQEIVDATKRLAHLVQQGRLAPDHIDEALFAQHLYAPDVPEPDLLIRTSGEQRISNFLLWQVSYCELYVTPTFWPDFSKADLLEAVAAYQQRQRRFGKTPAERG